MCYEIRFVPNYQAAVVYHRELKAAHPEAASEQTTSNDRKFILHGKEVTLPPASHPNSNKELVNFFFTVLSHKFAKLPIVTYPVEHFDTLFEQNIGTPEIAEDQYIPLFYKNFNKNDNNLLNKDVLVFPINYGYTWHLVVVDQPLNATKEGKVCDVYLVAAHPVTPHLAIPKLITKYLTMAFKALALAVIPNNFIYHDLVLEDHANQPQTLCCLFGELAYLIVENKRLMKELFTGIKQECFDLKMDNYIFARYFQTMLNCFAVEHNEFGQIADFDIITIENEDLSWVAETDIDRILSPGRQMRNARPIRQFAAKRNLPAPREKMSELNKENNGSRRTRPAPPS